VHEIKPSVNGMNIHCAETVAGANALVVFGASGDLTHRKLLISIFQLFTRDLLNDRFYLLGCGRKKFSDQDFRSKAKQSMRENCGFLSAKDLDAFTGRLYYIDGDYNDADFYRRIKTKIAELDGKYDVHENLLFYLSVPPFLYATIVEHLGSAGNDKLSWSSKSLLAETFRAQSS
jgi:glucose-6-phosphate 1-dehydrogenase